MKKALILFAAGLLLTACTDAPKHSDPETSMKDSTNSLSEFMFDDSDTDSSSSQSDSQQTNFLGGEGELRVIDNRNALYLEDDEWFYCGPSKMRKNAQGSELISQCRRPGCTHENTDCIISQYYCGGNHLISDGKALYLTEKNKLRSIDSSGSLTELFTLETDSAGSGLDPQSVVFSKLSRLNDTKVLCTADANNSEDVNMHLCFIFDQSDASFRYLDSSFIPYYISTDPAQSLLYCMKNDGKIYAVNWNDGSEACLTDLLADQPSIGGWAVSEGSLYYANMMGQYCRFDLQTKKRTLLNEKQPFEGVGDGFILLDRMLYSVNSDRTQILRGNLAWEQTECLYTSEKPILDFLALNENWLVFRHMEEPTDTKSTIGFLNLQTGEVTEYAAAHE